MISVSQAVQSLIAAASSPSVQLSRTALVAAALPPVSSVTLSLGTAMQQPFLYAASGLLTPALTSSEAPVPEPDVKTTAAPASPAPPANSTAAEVTTAAPSAPVSPIIPAVAENTATTVDTETITPLPVNVFVDPDVRALADFTTNPVHGGLATALYINAAIYRTRQFSSAALVSAIDLPRPVTSLNPINVDVADLSQQSAENQSGETPPAFDR